MVRVNEHRKVLSTVVTVMLYRQGDYVIAYCPALDLSSYAGTEEDAKKSFQEALSIFLEYCEEEDTLEQNLLACGWKLRFGYVQPDNVQVPLELLKADKLQSYEQPVSFNIG